MKKSKIISFVIISLVMLFCVGSFSYVINNYKNQSKNTVISIQNVLSQGKSNSTIGEYENLLTLYEEMEDSAFYSEQPEDKVYSQRVTPVLTNSNYFRINNISFEGECFTEPMVKQGSATVLISKTLAKKYFYGSRAIGRSFKMSGVRYRIIGIYDDKNDALNNLFKDNKERIYVNYTCHRDYKNQAIQQMSCTSDSKAYNNFAGAGLKNFERVSFEEKNMAVNDFTVIISLIFLAVIGVYLIKLWIYTLKSTAHYMSKKLEKAYLTRAVAGNIPSLLVRVLIILSIPALLFFLVIFVTKDFHIVYNYIDRENLFSLSHMLNKLAETLGRENSVVYGGNPYFINLYNGTLMLLAALTPVVVLMFFFFLHSFKNTLEDNKFRICTTAVFVFFTISSLAVSIFGGISTDLFQIIALVTAVLILKCTRDYLKEK